MREIKKISNFDYSNTEESRLLNSREVKELGLNPDRPNAELTSPFYFHVNGFELILPEGFISDLGSIPRGLWNCFPPVDARARIAFFIHDWGCHYRGRFIDVNTNQTVFIHKAALDTLFLQALEKENVPFIRRRLMFRAIRIFGPRYSK